MPENLAGPIGSIRPTLFIGLGGTGKEVLLRLRRKFYERLGRTGLPCTAYLWLDTDTRDVMARGEKVDEIYQAVTFDEDERIGLLQGTVGADMAQMFQNREQWRHVHKWLPDAVQRYGMDVADGAGGVRVIGRLAFFRHLSTAVAPRLEAILAKLRAHESINATKDFFHNRSLGVTDFSDSTPQVFVVSSLAGGTGCGIFLDTAFFLQHLKQHAHVPIERTIGILFMPNLFYEGSRGELAQRSFGNAYAALKELEYFSLRVGHGEVDVSVDFEVEWEPGRSLSILGPPFSVTYIEEKSNEKHVALTVENRTDVFGMVAESLFLDFMPGPFSTSKRSTYSNVVTHMSSPQAANVHSGAVSLPQVFSRRYASFGMSKVEIPVDVLKSACAARLAHDVAHHICRKSGDPHIRVNVERDAKERKLDADGLLSRHGSGWKERLRREVAAATANELSEIKDVNALESRLRELESRELAAEGSDRTQWGATVGLIRNQTEAVKQGVEAELADWVERVADNEARGPGLLAAEDGYLRFMSHNLRGLPAAFEERRRAAEKDGALYRKQVESAVRELRFALTSWVVALLGLKAKTVARLMERVRHAEEQYCLARGEEVLVKEGKAVAEAGAKRLEEQKPRLVQALQVIEAVSEAARARWEELLKIGEHVLFVRFFDRDRDWGAFYKLDWDGQDRPKEVSPGQESRGFLSQLGGGRFQHLLEVLGREGEAGLKKRLLAYGEERFWRDFDAHPREVDVLVHPQMQTRWRDSVERLVRSALPMARRTDSLGAQPVPVQRFAYLGVSNPNDPTVRRFVDDVTAQLSSVDIQQMDVQYGTPPWEVYLYVVAYAFPLPSLPIVQADCHPAYSGFYQDLLGGGIHEQRFHIPLHLSSAWEGRFEDLLVLGDREAAKVREAREILLLGPILRVLRLRREGESLRFSYVHGEFTENVVDMGARRDAVERLRNDDTLRQQFLTEVRRREADLGAGNAQGEDNLLTYFRIVQYLTRHPEKVTAGPPERSLLDERLEQLGHRLLQRGRAMNELKPPELDAVWLAQWATQLDGQELELMGGVPTLKRLEPWRRGRSALA